jgi:hypothetical protein
LQALEHEHRRLELRFDARVLQVEVIGVAGGDEAAREGGLADLPTLKYPLLMRDFRGPIPRPPLLRPRAS